MIRPARGTYVHTAPHAMVTAVAAHGGLHPVLYCTDYDTDMYGVTARRGPSTFFT